MLDFTVGSTIITISKKEYEKLVRDSERLKCIEALVKKKDYYCGAEISMILGIGKGEKKDDDREQNAD